MTISKKKKLRKKILNSLRDQAVLSTNKGKFVSIPFRLTKKQRRHSGWLTPKIVNKTMKYSEIIEQCLEPPLYYSDWDDWRDGFRDVTKLEKPNLFWDDEDRKIARAKNKKIKKQLAIRKARKEKTKHLNT